MAIKTIGDRFPTIEWWRDNVLWPGDEKRFGWAHYYAHYLQKYMIADLFKPPAIAEIGVRWGYSAFAFLCASPSASYTGFDIGPGGGHGGTKHDTFEWVTQMLERNFPGAHVKLVPVDTRAAETLGGPYDFVHVDGNHREAACYHDMQIALESLTPGGAMLVDDNTGIVGVTRACNRFLKDTARQIERAIRLPSLTGELIIIKRDAM